MPLTSSSQTEEIAGEVRLMVSILQVEVSGLLGTQTITGVCIQEFNPFEPL